jgi:hypothetical protein
MTRTTDSLNSNSGWNDIQTLHYEQPANDGFLAYAGHASADDVVRQHWLEVVGGDDTRVTVVTVYCASNHFAVTQN